MAVEADQPPLLVLPGGLGVADGGGEALRLLEQGRRLYRIDHAEAPDLDALIAAVLRASAGAPAFDLIGFSIGGWFAQCIAALMPDRVRKVVLAHSFVLEPKLRWRFSVAVKIWPLLPRRLVQAGVMRSGRLALAPLQQANPDAHDQKLRTLAVRLRGADALDALVAQQRLIRETLADPLGTVVAPMLIIDSDSDPLVGKAARAQLRRNYPQADHVEFPAAGHASALVAPEAFTAVVDRFLRS